MTQKPSTVIVMPKIGFGLQKKKIKVCSFTFPLSKALVSVKILPKTFIKEF